MLLACALPRRGPGTGTRPVQGPHRPVAMASSTMPGRRLLLACPGSNGRVRRNRQPFGLILVFWFGGVGGAAGPGRGWGGRRRVRLACSDDDFLFGERSGRVVAQAHRGGGLCEAGALGGYVENAADEIVITGFLLLSVRGGEKDQSPRRIKARRRQRGIQPSQCRDESLDLGDGRSLVSGYRIADSLVQPDPVGEVAEQSPYLVPAMAGVSRVIQHSFGKS